MPLEPIFEKLKVREKIGEVISQIKVECKTDIATESVDKILNENVCATVTLGSVVKGKAEYVGKATFFICYTTADGIKKCECGAEIKDSLILDAIAEGDSVKLSFETEKPEVDLSGVKTSVSAYLTVKGEIYRKKEYPALNGGDGIFCDNKVIEKVDYLGGATVIYTIEEEFEVPYAVAEVMCHRAEACVTSAQCGVGTVILDGEVYLSEILLQSGDKNDIIRENRVFPYRAEIAVDEAMPQILSSGAVRVKTLKTDVSVDQDKNLSVVTVNVTLSVFGEAYSVTEESFAGDAFEVEKELALKKEKINFEVMGEPFSVFAKFSARTAAEGLENAKAVAVVSEKAEITSSEITGGELLVTGAIGLNSLFLGEDNKLFSQKTEIPFEHRIPYSGKAAVNVVAVPKSSAVKIVGGKELDCEAETVFTVCERKEISAEIISAVEIGAEKKRNDSAISVYIPVEGEDLWGLAKRLNVCPDSLLATNKDLQFPLTGKERIAVYRQK